MSEVTTDETDAVVPEVDEQAKSDDAVAPQGDEAEVVTEDTEGDGSAPAEAEGDAAPADEAAAPSETEPQD